MENTTRNYYCYGKLYDLKCSICGNALGTYCTGEEPESVKACDHIDYSGGDDSGYNTFTQSYEFNF